MPSAKRLQFNSAVEYLVGFVVKCATNNGKYSVQCVFDVFDATRTIGCYIGCRDIYHADRKFMYFNWRILDIATWVLAEAAPYYNAPERDSLLQRIKLWLRFIALRVSRYPLG